MQGVGPAAAAELAQLDPVGIVPLVLLRGVVALLAGGALQGDDHRGAFGGHVRASTKKEPGRGARCRCSVAEVPVRRKRGRRPQTPTPAVGIAPPPRSDPVTM